MVRAQTIIEKGARLDIANADGVSLDYYLKDWKDSVFGAHPPGWEQVRSPSRAAAPARLRPRLLLESCGVGVAEGPIGQGQRSPQVVIC